jgi:hypothetical protein
MSDFQKALDELPDGTGLDNHHQDIGDLVFLCLHELDMHHEGEYQHTLKRLQQYRKFIYKWGGEWSRNQVDKMWPTIIRRNEFYGF